MFPQSLEHQRVGHVFAGSNDIGVDLLHADLGVLDRPVIGDHHPVEPIGIGVPHVVDHPVLPVGGVLGVDVMIPGQPAISAPRAFHRFTLRRGRGSCRAGRGEHADGGARTEHAGCLEEPTPVHLVRREFGVVDLQVQHRAQLGRFTAVVGVTMGVVMIVNLAAVGVLHADLTSRNCPE